MSIDVCDPELAFAITAENWRREHRVTPDTFGSSDDLAIRFKSEDVALVRRIWDAGARAVAKKLHPDHGGNSLEMAEANALIRAVRSQLSVLADAG